MAKLCVRARQSPNLYASELHLSLLFVVYFWFKSFLLLHCADGVGVIFPLHCIPPPLCQSLLLMQCVFESNRVDAQIALECISYE